MSDHWLVRPTTIRRLWIVFLGVLALTVLADFFVTPAAHFAIEATFGFNAWYGFLSCAAMILFAKGIVGFVLKRPDDYYDDRHDDD
jgi:sterol desaturase/sphingolipid hydroxylase (fatty acid hydroxylase superfamily)